MPRGMPRQQLHDSRLSRSVARPVCRCGRRSRRCVAGLFWGPCAGLHSPFFPSYKRVRRVFSGPKKKACALFLRKRFFALRVSGCSEGLLLTRRDGRRGVYPAVRPRQRLSQTLCVVSHGVELRTRFLPKIVRESVFAEVECFSGKVVVRRLTASPQV